ncbi:DNA repair protein REV1 isoform X1 [Takifugu rubripes]|uniref:DNA repair protein REV1 isoform X1 n=1 Tax=Takifugu rubripes TaxID=31033 RepID=UPI001145D588|nr:DNA repair protein REV1 isoform X1 [Takifugu rubripes]
MSRDGWMKKKANASDDNGWAERGGYMAAKVSKLHEQFKLEAPKEKQKEGSSSNIFCGVSIYVNGYTEPSADELRRLMMLHGGQFHVYYSRTKTTHIIANNLPNNKIQELKGRKVIKPEWITDSVKAGHLLPYLQYQLYAKHKGPLFPGMTLRQISDVAGSSQELLKPSTHQKPHLHQHSNQEQFPPTCQTKSTHPSSLSRTHCPNPQTCQTASTHISADPKEQTPSDHPHKPPPPSSVQTPHPNLVQRACSLQPQINSSCSSAQSSCKKVHLRRNGLSQTSFDAASHLERHELKESDKNDPAPHVVDEALLTNGHARLVNGALKLEDSPLDTDKQSVGKELSEFRLKNAADKPQSRTEQFDNKPDPYEFPHSPHEQQSSSQEDQPSKRPPLTNQGVGKSKTHLPAPSCQAELTRAPPDSPLTKSPVRLNGCHNSTFSASTASKSTTESASSSSTAPVQLLAQTSGLISEFYSRSRLHQISTWRNSFSEYVNELHSRRKAAGAPSFPGKERLRKRVAQQDGQGVPSGVKSCIFHVDMDCFFVSVAIRNRPDLKGKPVAVTSNRGAGKVLHRPGANPQLERHYYQWKQSHTKSDEDLYRTPSQESPESNTSGAGQETAALSMAEIASCSYEARQAGVRNGMFFGKAKQLCPSLQAVPYDFEAYKEVALTMYETLAGYTHDIEALSCDELLIDSSALLAELCISPEELAKAIRADIKEKTGCCASVGMGSNILLARLATRKAKPDGQHFLRSEDVDDFIRDLPVTSLPGVGPVMSRKLVAMGVRSCGDLQQVSLSQLQKKFGPRTGQTLFRFCRGLDDRPVRYEKERKSVSADMNYNIRFTTVNEAECFLTNLSMEVQKRLQEAGLRGRRVTLKVMVRKVGAPQEPAKYGGHGICDNLARTVMLAQSTDHGEVIASAVIKLFHAMNLQVQDLRGVGIQVQLLDGNAHQDSVGPRKRSIKEMLLDQGSGAKSGNQGVCPSIVSSVSATSTERLEIFAVAIADITQQEKTSTTASSSSFPPLHLTLPEPVPGTSRSHQTCRQTPKHSRTRLNCSIEVPSPSQVDRSVLEALPAELKEQVLQSWTKTRPVSPPPTSAPALYTPPVGTLVLQIPNHPDSPGIVLELPNFSQVDPDVFAALPKELQEELRSAYNRGSNAQLPAKILLEQKNPLLQLKESGVGIGRMKRRYKRKNANSPVKKGPSPVKRNQATKSPAKIPPPSIKTQEPLSMMKAEICPSTSTAKSNISEPSSKILPRPPPTLAGACDLTDIKTLLREWVTTITEPMEEDILQVVKYCTDLIEDKDLEKLDLIIKYMKRLMKQSVESVWSMAFDFVLDNVQVVLQQTYGSTLKIS